MSFKSSPPSIKDHDEKKSIIAVRVLFISSVLITCVMCYYFIQNMKKVNDYTNQQNNYISTTSTLYEIRSLFFKIVYDIQFGTANHYFINQDIGSLEKAILKFDSSYQNKHNTVFQNKHLHLIHNELYHLVTLHNNTLLEKQQPISAHNMVANINNAINSLLEEANKEYSSISSYKSHYTSQNQGFYILNLLLAFSLLGTSYIIVDQQLIKNRYYKKLLVKRVDELNATNSELEQYTYIASHDLQEPTRKIIVLCDRLLETSSEGNATDTTNMLQKIRNSSLRMNSLVNDLLLFSHISNVQIEKQKIDLNILIESIVSDFSDVIKEKNATLLIESLPTLTLYESQVFQLFSNLLSNALKYSKQGIPPIIQINHVITKGKDINFTAVTESETLFSKISISDNGIGFKQEYSSRIFKPFQRLHNNKEYSGTGIGLAICEKVVKNNNGYIETTSELHKGAVFSVYFPHL